VKYVLAVFENLSYVVLIEEFFITLAKYHAMLHSVRRRSARKGIFSSVRVNVQKKNELI